MGTDEAIALSVIVTWLGRPFVEGVVDPKAAGTWLRQHVIACFGPYTETVLRRAKEMLHDVGDEPAAIAPKRLLPILEGASLEDDPQLQELWAALLANETRGSSSTRHNYASILRELTPIDARALDQIAGTIPQHVSMSVHAANNRISWESRAALLHKLLRTPTTLTSFDIDTSLDNLARLGLIRVTSELRDPRGGVDPADRIPTEILSITMLGVRFVTAIRPPRLDPS